MPDAAERIRRMLGVGAASSGRRCRRGTLSRGNAPGRTSSRCFHGLRKRVEELRACRRQQSTSRHPSPTAPRCHAALLRQLLRRGSRTGSSLTPPTDDARLAIDDFMKVELRVAKVLEAEAVPKSKKLIKLQRRRRHRAADDPRRHRRGVSARSARRTDDRRSSRNLKPREADGDRVEQGWCLAASVEGGAPTLVAVDRACRPARGCVRLDRLHCPPGRVGLEFSRRSRRHGRSRRGASSGAALAACARHPRRPTTSRSWSRRRPWRRDGLAVRVLGRRASARGGKFAAGSRGGGAAVDAAIDAQPLTRGRRRDRPRLPLRLRAARRAAGTSFADQIRLRRTRRLPIVIHTREAEDDTFRILDEERRGDVGGRVPLLHRRPRRWRGARSTSASTCRWPASSRFRARSSCKEVARMVPLDRLLIETDSPFLAPVPHRGQTQRAGARGAGRRSDCASCAATRAEAIGRATADNFDASFNP